MIIISGFKKDFLGLNKEIAYPSMEEGLKFDALNYGQVYDFTHFSLVIVTVILIYTQHKYHQQLI